MQRKTKEGALSGDEGRRGAEDTWLLISSLPLMCYVAWGKSLRSLFSVNPGLR